MSMLADISGPDSGSFFGGPSVTQPTLNDLLLRVGGDFTYNCMQRRAAEDRIRAAQAMPGNSVATPVYGIRGAIGNGLRAIAARYFTPKPLSFDNTPGYRRIGA